MAKVIYTSEPQLPNSQLISPIFIVKDIFSHWGLILAYSKREFQNTHRATYLGLFWTVLSPLLMLALYALVFGYIFKGRFTHRPEETPAEFALALFVGLAFFQCISICLNNAPSLIVANSAFVKTLSFPLQVLSVSSVLNVLFNLSISMVLALIGSLFIFGSVHLAAVCMLIHALCIALIALGVSWFFSALGIYIRDVGPILQPVNVILMYVSLVFFPLSAVPPKIRWLFELNPIALIVEQARSAFLYGVWPHFGKLGLVFIFSVLIAIFGYWFFMRTKAGFADVM